MKRLYLSLVICLLPLIAGGQALRGSYFSENSVTRNKLNPAFTPRAAYLGFGGIDNLGIGLTSNIGLSNFVFPSGSGSVLTFMHPDVSSETFLGKLPANPHFDVDVDTDILSLGFFTGKNSFWTIGLGLKVDAEANLPHELFAFLKNGATTFIAGSSWQPDEDIVVPYFNSHAGMKLIIAPHEFDAERLEQLKKRMNRPVLLYSEATEENVANADCLIIDCFGILSSCYRYAHVAYIGGGFGAGIHNLNEAAVYGIPVIFGPNHAKFKEAGDLITCGGGFSISCKEDFETIADRLLSDSDYLSVSGNAAGNYIKSHLGATRKIYNEIFGGSAVG